MKLIALLLAGAAILVTGVWLLFRPGFDSAAAFVVALAAEAALLVVPKASARRSMTQSVDRGAIGIQSGRDTNLGTINQQGTRDGE